MRIIALVGESGSGKSKVAELLEKEGLKNIPSFTTRKPRYEGEKGHVFTTVKQYECNRARGSIVAETYFDGNYYWTTEGQFNEDCVYAIDPVGVKRLKQRFKDAVTVIYLKCDEGERLIRLSSRDRVIERIKHDREAFKVIKCDYVIDANRPIEEVMENIKVVIGLNEV